VTTDEERKQREQRDMVLTVAGVALLAVAGWYLAPLLVAAILGVVGARLWRRVSGASGSSPRLLGAVVGCGVGVALVAAVLPSPAWIGDYDHRLRALSVPEMRQARAEAHRQARNHRIPLPATSGPLRACDAMAISRPGGADRRGDRPGGADRPGPRPRWRRRHDGVVAAP